MRGLPCDPQWTVAVALGFWRGTSGSTWLVAALLVAGAAAQALPRASRARSRPPVPVA